MAYPMLEEIETYWTDRSEPYCTGNREELASFRRQAWQDLIQRHAPQYTTAGLRVLDAGTGPGFLALLMADRGHCVTGVDYTDAMLEKARENAAARQRIIDFRKMDVQNLGFAGNTFDLVVARNLTWNLETPEAAYGEFYRVLRPGGQLLNFDANWYRYLFDDRAYQGYMADRQNTRREGYPDHQASDTAKRMETMAAALPLSRACRPDWDRQTLASQGFENIRVEQDIGLHVWDRVQQVNSASTPLFMISAHKPRRTKE